jgi:hypothetical protein
MLVTDAVATTLTKLARRGTQRQRKLDCWIARHFLAACNVIRLIAKAARSGAVSRFAPPARR